MCIRTARMGITSMMTALAVMIIVVCMSVSSVDARPQFTVPPSLDGQLPSVPYNESLAKLLTLYSAAAYSNNPPRICSG
jgi:hypothetical protein